MNNNTNTHKILLVDDRIENLFSLEGMLEQDGREFFKAESGSEALKIAFKEDLSLIMLDVQMPGMDGFATANILQSNPKTAHVPIVFVTAINKEQKHIVKGLKGGAIDYLFKPLDIDVTRAKVETLLKFFDQQQELERTVKKLEELNQEKNRILGIVAHDLRNPLGNIMVLSDILLNEEPRLEGEQGEFAEMIYESGSFLLKLVESLLDVSKIEAGKLELELVNRNIVEILEHTLKVNKHLSEKKGIQVHFSPQFNEMPLQVDEGKIQQVFNNLISNAIKFSNPNTTVRVQAEKVNGHTLISVQDEGRGIAEEDMNKLFKYFSKTSTQSTAGEESTGLGLAICKKIVEAHEGSIHVESELGKGSTFTVTLNSHLN